MKRWAVVFQNFGGPRIVRKTYTRSGAERVVARLRRSAPEGARVPSRMLYVQPQNDRRRQVSSWPSEQERRRPSQQAPAPQGDTLAISN